MSQNMKDHTAVGMYKEDGTWFLVVNNTIVPLAVVFELEVQVTKETGESAFQSTMQALMNSAVENEILDIIRDVNEQAKLRDKNNTDKGLN